MGYKFKIFNICMYCKEEGKEWWISVFNMINCFLYIFFIYKKEKIRLSKKYGGEYIGEYI